eukprot:scaffold2290_cov170-Amphora_coffeaeformis.AAC.1
MKCWDIQGVQDVCRRSCEKETRRKHQPGSRLLTQLGFDRNIRDDGANHKNQHNSHTTPCHEMWDSVPP